MVRRSSRVWCGRGQLGALVAVDADLFFDEFEVLRVERRALLHQGVGHGHGPESGHAHPSVGGGLRCQSDRIKAVFHAFILRRSSLIDLIYRNVIVFLTF